MVEQDLSKEYFTEQLWSLNDQESEILIIALASKIDTLMLEPPETFTETHQKFYLLSALKMIEQLYLGNKTIKGDSIFIAENALRSVSDLAQEVHQTGKMPDILGGISMHDFMNHALAARIILESRDI